MCGGVIIADFILRNRDARRVSDVDLWPTFPFAKSPIIFSDNDSASNLNRPPPPSDAAEKKPKRQRKNLYRGIQQQPWGKWAVEIRDPRSPPTAYSHTHAPNFNHYEFEYDLNNQIEDCATEPLVVSGDEISGSNSEESLPYEQINSSCSCLNAVKAEEEAEEREASAEELNEVEKLSDQDPKLID